MGSHLHMVGDSRAIANVNYIIADNISANDHRGLTITAYDDIATSDFIT